MRVIDIGKLRKARIWSGELPPAIYSCRRIATHVIRNHPAAHGDGPGVAAIELLIPLGARALYGLLGGRWESAGTAELTVNVCISSPSERVFAESLANGIEEVRVGLLDEHAQGVLDGIDLAKGELNALPAGKLCIECAAYGMIGSSEAIYKHLALALIKLLTLPANPTDRQLIELFPSTFS